MKARAYQHKLRGQLAEWQERIDELRRRVEQAGPDSRLDLEYRIQDLLAKQVAARRKLDQLERTDDAVARETRARLEEARDKLGRTLRRIVSGTR